MNKPPLNVLIIGTGMYVCGRGTKEFGTILPAIYEWKRNNQLGNVYIAGTKQESINILKRKVVELNKLFGYEVEFKFYPINGSDPDAYKIALSKISKPACAMVVVPDSLHRKIAGDAVEKGFHTLVVKPLAPTLKEVNELIKLQEKHNVYCAVEFHKRLDLSNIKLRDSIESGKIGDPLYFIVEYSQRKSIPKERFRNWVETTNIFQYLGIHYVDIVHFATGAIPKRAMAIGQKSYLVSHGIDTYDSIQAVIEWETLSGEMFVSTFNTNWIDPERTSAVSDQKIKVIGTMGRYEADQKRRGIFIVNDKDGIEEPNPDFCTMYGTGESNTTFQGYGIESIIQFLSDVVDVEAGNIRIEDLEGKRPTFKGTVVPTVVLEAVNSSLNKNGEWITTDHIGEDFLLSGGE